MQMIYNKIETRYPPASSRGNTCLFDSQVAEVQAVVFSKWLTPVQTLLFGTSHSMQPWGTVFKLVI